MLDKFLADTDSDDVKPVTTSAPQILDPGPVPAYVPTAAEAQAAKKPFTH
jgi:hypothetical protein